jgi:S-layer protein (TIGR01567 family)
MKRFAASALAALMLLTVFASAAIAADDNNTTAAAASVVEIRGPVYNGSDLPTILANTAYGDGTKITMDANKFAAFFYDINNNVTTETLSIVKTPDTTGRTIGQHALVYSTTIEQTNYKYKGVPAWSNSTYSVLGFFADKYIPLKSNDASKLAKLVLDSKDKYTLKTGEKLDLGSGYSLTAKQVDVDGKKVWLELDNNGQYVDDQVVDTSNGDATWTDTHDKIQGEDTVQIFKVHVDSVFQGAVDSVAQIEGLWLIDYANAIKISTSDSFGKLDDVSINGATLTISNKDTFSLSRDSDEEIGQGLYFRIADADALRFYAFKQETDPGTYDIRGTVATGAFNWTADSFAGFFYDLNKNVKTETMNVNAVNGRVIPVDGLKYSTTIQNVGYKYNSGSWATQTYPVLGFFAEKYVPLKSNDASKLAKLVLDSKDKYTLKTGEKLDLGSGYSLTAKQVDVDGKKVWLELDNNGQYVDDQVVDTSNGDATWTDTHDKIQGEDTVQIFKVHVDSVFQGAVDSVAQIEGLWLIDYANAIKISTSDEFGVLNDVSINGPTINIQNKDTFTLSRDSEESIGQGMYFEIADSNDLRYYPYVQVTLGNGTGVGTTTGTPSTNETVTTPAATNETAPSENVTETVATNETPSAVGETPVAVANNTTTKPNTPGFEALPAIFGLLVIVYLVRRNK